jgi:predicted NUDIX family NTP pyrophosphohydrolase
MARRAEISAGLLLYRRKPALEVLLAHPGGPFWERKDEAAWTIPKGLVDADSDLLACATREFTEETGLPIQGDFTLLPPVRQKSGKTVHAFAVEADPDLAPFRSNAFELEWPPRSGRKQQFPEIDRIAWFDLDTALGKIHGYQQPLLRELAKRLKLS